MDRLAYNENITDDDMIKHALSGSQPLSAYIRDLEKLQTSLSLKIQTLAISYHENIIGQQDNLQTLGSGLKTLLSKASSLQTKTKKLSNELENCLDKMNEGVTKLEKVQEASEKVKILQHLLLKIKKNRSVQKPDAETLKALSGLNILEKIISG